MSEQTSGTSITWRFGDRPEDADAWLAHPDKLHIYIDFQCPETPPGCWHRVMGVTKAWVRTQINEPMVSAYWPALAIVPDGTRAEIERAVSHLLGNGGWRLIVTGAILLPVDYVPVEW
jgi:hypothetical protein